jgi:hypothetical protein
MLLLLFTLPIHHKIHNNNLNQQHREKISQKLAVVEVKKGLERTDVGVEEANGDHELNKKKT